MISISWFINPPSRIPRPANGSGSLRDYTWLIGKDITLIERKQMNYPAAEQRGIRCHAGPGSSPGWRIRHPV